MPVAVLCVAAALAACSDALEQDTTAGQVVGVAEGAVTPTVTLVSAAELTVSHTIALRPLLGDGRVAGRGSVLIVVGYLIAVIDLALHTDTVTNEVHVDPESVSGIAGAIQSDSVAWASYERSFPGIPTRYVVWRVNYRTNDTTSISFTANPRAIALGGNAVFVVSVADDDESWLTVLDTTLTNGSPRIKVLDSVPLTGLGARGITLGSDGYLYVTSSTPITGGRSTEGRLAIVDPVSRHEVAVINGLGDGLGSPVYHPSGRVLIPSVNGILEVDAARRSVTLGPGKGVKPAGDAPSFLAVDQGGRIYAVVGRHCGDPASPAGAVHVLSPPPDYDLTKTISIGPCPSGAAPATIP
jgi:hypothetical protein